MYGSRALALLVATPFTYYAITRWLQNFSERIVISPFNFVLAGICVLLVALLAVSHLSFKAANTNPGKTLQNE